MLKLIKLLLQGKSLYLAIIATIAIAILSLINIGELPINFTFLDKIEHAFSYFVITLLWLFATKKKGTKFVVIIAVVLYGILLEILQSQLTDYRTFEYMDMLANTFGVLLGFLAFRFIEKKQFKLLNSL